MNAPHEGGQVFQMQVIWTLNQDCPNKGQNTTPTTTTPSGQVNPWPRTSGPSLPQ
jgi:hypothetical protein